MARTVLIEAMEVDRPVKQKESLGEGLGFRMVTVGHERVIVRVEIDMDEVKSVAHTAARNTSGKSKSGPIHAKVTSRSRIGGAS